VAAGVVNLVTSGADVRRGLVDVNAARQHQLPLEQPGIVFRCRWRTRGPRVRAKVVVIPAGCEKQRSGIAPHHFVQPKGVVIKRLGVAERSHVKVHVPDDRSRRHAIPTSIPPGPHERMKIERLGGHVQLAAGHLPL
jgi:hypothetical protein